MSVELFSVSAAPVVPELPAVAWRAFVADTKTGRVVGDLPYVGRPTWEFGVNLQGGGGLNIPIGGDMSAGDLQALLDPWRFSVGLAYGSFITQLGPLVTYGMQDQEGPVTIPVGITGLWGLLRGKRLLLNSAWAGTNPAEVAADLNLSGLSLHTIAKRLVESTLARLGGDLPVDLPADIVGTATREYPGYDLAFVGERLAQLTQVDGGPEIEFRPRFTDSSETAVRWEMRIGNPRLGQLGFPHAWDYGAALTHLDEDVDGSRQTFRRWERGNGMERQLLSGMASDTSLTSSGWPLLEDVGGDHTSATEQSTLDSWALAGVQTFRLPTKTWSAQIRVAGDDGLGRRTGSPALSELAAGDNARLSTAGHRWIPEGEFAVRVLGVSSGELPDTAKLTLAPLQGSAE